MERFKSIIEALAELQNDTGVSKSVKEALGNTISALKDDSDPQIRIHKALNLLEELAELRNIQPYTRTQLFNMVSLLEMI